MKKRIVLISFMFVMLVFISCATYSAFKSGTGIVVNQEVAEFVVDAKRIDHLEIPITDLNPGDSDSYLFSVSNIKDDLKSHVTVDYQIIIQTYHFMPLNIELYKIEEEKETLIMICDETYTRNDSNALVCNSEIQQMSHENDVLDNYKIKIEYDKKYNSSEYSDLVDFIDITIKSWQKVGGEDEDA